MKFRIEDFNKEVYNIFSGYVNVENEEINRLRRELEELKNRNRELRMKLAKLESENKKILKKSMIF